MEDRIIKLETNFERMAGDISSLKTSVDRIERALVGDTMTTGALPDIRERCTRNEERIDTVNQRIDNIEIRSFKPEEIAQIKHVVSIFTGWKLVVGAILWLLPLLIFLINFIQKQ